MRRTRSMNLSEETSLLQSSIEAPGTLVVKEVFSHKRLASCLELRLGSQMSRRSLESGASRIRFNCSRL